MFQQNLATITKLASDAATSLANLSTAGSTACDCGDAQCRGGSPFQFLIGHPQQHLPNPEIYEPTDPEQLELQSEPGRLCTPGLGDIEELEVLLYICSFLPPKDLGRLACVARKFGQKMEWPRDLAYKPDGPNVLVTRSVVEESARRWVAALSAGRSELASTSWMRQKHDLMVTQATDMI